MAKCLNIHIHALPEAITSAAPTSQADFLETKTERKTFHRFLSSGMKVKVSAIKKGSWQYEKVRLNQVAKMKIYFSFDYFPGETNNFSLMENAAILQCTPCQKFIQEDIAETLSRNTQTFNTLAVNLVTWIKQINIFLTDSSCATINHKCRRRIITPTE